MNEFTAKNEQAFLDACGAIGVEPNAMIEPHKERYLVSEFLKDPVSWLKTELLYYSYTTPGEAQEVANGIDRMISDRWCSPGFDRSVIQQAGRRGFG
jgi:hypothetical protein